MTLQERLKRQFDNCCRPIQKPLVKPKPPTGIAKHFDQLEDIQTEYQRTFATREGN